MNVDALTAFFNDASQLQQELGVVDCVSFAIIGIHVGWGVDYREILGYHDRRSAVDRLRIAGGLKQAFIDELGDTVDGAQLQPGDLAWFEDPAIGLVMPGYVAVKMKRSIGRVPMSVVGEGWRTWVQ